MAVTGIFAGGCQCGAVRYELRDPEWASICHCRMCQRASGQPFMTFLGGNAGKVVWTRGKPSIFQSSDIAERGFCSQCGTPLTYGRKAAGTLSVTMGSLDDPAIFEPTRQNGIEDKVAWLDGLAGVPGVTVAEWMASAGIDSITSRQQARAKG